jgi:spore coat polysaccharide biosynthesis protein SpsF (cytidylyltransferase family)
VNRDLKARSHQHFDFLYLPSCFAFKCNLYRYTEENTYDYEVMEKVWDQGAKAALTTRAGEIRGANEKALSAKKAGHGDGDGDLSWTTGRY